MEMFSDTAAFLMLAGVFSGILLTVLLLMFMPGRLTKFVITIRRLIHIEAETSQKGTLCQEHIDPKVCISDQLISKVDKLGLADLSVGRTEISWRNRDVESRIEDTPDGGSIFVVGRTLLSWTDHYRKLAIAIVEKGVHCIFVLADPNSDNLESAVRGDKAEGDLQKCWSDFEITLSDQIEEITKRNNGTRLGSLRVYGIPTYIAASFSDFVGADNIRFCCLEVGIGVDPSERPIFYFQKMGSDGDIYTSLNKIYRGILKHREPILEIPSV